MPESEEGRRGMFSRGEGATKRTSHSFSAQSNACWNSSDVLPLKKFAPIVDYEEDAKNNVCNHRYCLKYLWCNIP